MVTYRVFVTAFLFVLGLVALAPAQEFTTLYNFADSSDGGYPIAGVIQDPTGNLYGTAAEGGNSGLNCNPYGCGVVFKLDTTRGETVFHSFSGRDGRDPSAPMILDRADNLYGTTVSGGLRNGGIVFKIDGAGRETKLYGFTGNSDGCAPSQGLLRDQSGNLYGTTGACTYHYGTIFRIGTAGKFTLLHSFNRSASDGAYPLGGHLTMDKSGNLFGVTQLGGASDAGVLYKVSRSGKFMLLHSFAAGTADGCGPLGSVLQDEAGNFYGTTESCGSHNYGTIWKLSRNGRETILHNFAGGTSDGCNPQAGVSRDSKGNLYGVTYGCGANSYGALYKLDVNGVLIVLHSFDLSDGGFPVGEMLRTTKGTLFGTTYSGGTGNCAQGCGTVWSYKP